MTATAAKLNLTTRHLADLRGSGLSDATIASCGFYSESDHRKIRRLLNWPARSETMDAKALGSCLVFPHRQLDGQLNGHAAVKPDHPRQKDNGGILKYESPYRLPPKPYFTPAAINEIPSLFSRFLFTEGAKKAAAAAQAGYPAIGLTGPHGWQKKRPKDSKGRGTGPRYLLPELAAIDWFGRYVIIIFDTDPRRNFGVNHGLAELARVLTEHGAIVKIIYLPIGPPDKDGIPAKVGIDDYIVANGAKAFCDFINSQTSTSRTRSLDDYREELARNRVDSVGNPGVRLDMSPTGSGKSHADKAACKKAGASLTIQPEHHNCTQTEDDYRKFGLDAAAYPQMNDKTCRNFTEAERCLNHGLSPSQAVCPGCQFRDGCDYQDLFQIADSSDHRISTHHRAELSFEQLVEGRSFISIHEDSSNLLRPKFEIARGLERVAEVANQARHNAKETSKQKERATAEWFFELMIRIANNLAENIDDRDDTTRPIELPTNTAKPSGLDAKLYRAMKETKVWPSGEAMQLVKAIAAGEICELVVRVDRIRKRGKKDEFETRRAIVGFKQTKLPPNATTWISDATADPRETQILAGCPVIVCTPTGQLNQRHPAIQIACDIKQSTAPSKVVGLIRALIMAIPDTYQAIGVICDQRHVSSILGTARKGPRLDGPELERIAKVEYFRNGSSRGSNEWLDTCDLLIVFGTPRLPPSAIKTRLIQLGKVTAACRSDDWICWGKDYWSGVTTSGKRFTVEGTGYRDRDWHAAYRAMVASELEQSIGRGRGICDNGMPVIVLSNEPLDLPLTDFILQPIGEFEAEVLRVLTTGFPKGFQKAFHDSELSTGFPKGFGKTLTTENPNNILGNPVVSSSQVAEAVNKSESHTRDTIRDLASRGLVKKVGERGGWILSQPPTIDLYAAAGIRRTTILVGNLHERQTNQAAVAMFDRRCIPSACAPLHRTRAGFSDRQRRRRCDALDDEYRDEGYLLGPRKKVLQEP